MYNHNKAQQSKNRVHISWDIMYMTAGRFGSIFKYVIFKYFVEWHLDKEGACS